jgi:hypothetical protein
MYRAGDERELRAVVRAYPFALLATPGGSGAAPAAR